MKRKLRQPQFQKLNLSDTSRKLEILLWRYQNLKYSTCSAKGVTKFRKLVKFTAYWPAGIGQVKMKIVETRVVVKSCPNWDWPPLDHEIQIGQK